MAGTFTADLSKFKTKTGVQTNAVIRRVAYDLFRRVIQKTPVDTGRARANWLPAVGEIPTGTTDETDKSGAMAKGAARASVQNFEAGGVIYLANNLPYIGALENGHSERQAPAGMVGLSLIEVQANLAGIVRGVRGE